MPIRSGSRQRDRAPTPVVDGPLTTHQGLNVGRTLQRLLRMEGPVGLTCYDRSIAYWRCLMQKVAITPEEFIDEINRRLPEHDCYTPGLQMFLVPRNGVGNDAIG